MNKKALIIAAVVIGIAVIGGGVYAFKNLMGGPEQAPADTQKRKVAEPLNVIPLEERPYLKIVPLADGHNVEIAVEIVKKEATSAEYELEYQAGSLLQGAFGAIDTLPGSTKVLLGSCSAGGACTFHEDVKGGTLLTRYTGPENYALKSDWRYFDNAAKEAAFSSKDAKFQIESKDLATQRYLVIFNTAGFPEDLEGTPVSDPYSLTTSGALKGKAKLTMRANEEGELKIMGYDGTSWHEFTGQVDGKMITAEVDLMELYIVVK